MEILDFNVWLDGGTITIDTDKGLYSYDNQIGTKTKGMLRCNGIEVTEQSEEIELIESLKHFKKEFYDKSIKLLIEEKEKLWK